MAETRLRGQEVTVRLARGGNVENTITAFKSVSMQWDLATIEEGYIGETTMRKDMIFNGVSGSLDVDAEDEDILLFIDFVAEKAQRKQPVSSRINMTARFTFPNGQTPRVLVRDLQFDAIPFGAASRDAYVGTSLSFKASDKPTILTR